MKCGLSELVSVEGDESVDLVSWCRAGDEVWTE